VKILNQVKARYLVTSDPLRTERRVELVALCLAVLLVLQLLYSVVRVVTLSLPDSRPVAAGTLRIVKADQFPEVTAQEQKELVERPLFWASRRQLVAPPPTPAAKDKTLSANAQAGDLNKVKLLGIFSGEESAGVIAMVAGNKERILVHEKALEWTLDSVAMDRAVFTYDGQSQELLLTQGQLPAGRADKPDKRKGQGKQGKRNSDAKKLEASGIKRLGSSGLKDGKVNGDPKNINGIK
jgi:hypothetical protein